MSSRPSGSASDELSPVQRDMNKYIAVTAIVVFAVFAACRQGEPSQLPTGPVTSSSDSAPEGNPPTPATPKGAGKGGAPSSDSVEPEPDSVPKVLSQDGESKANGKPVREAPPAAGASSVEVLVDCNKSIWNFGLQYRGGRYKLQEGSGLAGVLAALKRALGSTTGLISAERRLCGFADHVACQEPEPDGSIWDICKPFDEDRTDGNIGTALEHLEKRARLDNTVGVFLTHGFAAPPERGQLEMVDAGAVLDGLPIDRLGKALGAGTLSVAAVMLDQVPYRASKYGGVKLPRNGDGKPVSAMAVFVIGPQGATLDALLQSLQSQLPAFRPRGVVLRGRLDGQQRSRKLGPVEVRVTKASGAPGSISSRCVDRGTPVASCTATLPSPKIAYSPHMELFAVSLMVDGMDTSHKPLPSWSAQGSPRELQADVTATYGDETVDVAGYRLIPNTGVPAALDDGLLRLKKLAGVDTCDKALKLLDSRLTGLGLSVAKPSPQLPVSAALIVPVQCLLRRGAGPYPLPSVLRAQLKLELDAPAGGVSRAQLGGLLDAVGLPKTDTAGGDRVIGFREALHAIAAAGERESWRGHASATATLATVEVGFQ